MISRASISAVAGAHSEFSPTSDRPVKARYIFWSPIKDEEHREGEEKTQTRRKIARRGRRARVYVEKENEKVRERKRESRRRRERQ